MSDPSSTPLPSAPSRPKRTQDPWFREYLNEKLARIRETGHPTQDPEARVAEHRLLLFLQQEFDREYAAGRVAGQETKTDHE